MAGPSVGSMVLVHPHVSKMRPFETIHTEGVFVLNFSVLIET